MMSQSGELYSRSRIATLVDAEARRTSWHLVREITHLITLSIYGIVNYRKFVFRQKFEGQTISSLFDYFKERTLLDGYDAGSHIFLVSCESLNTASSCVGELAHLGGQNLLSSCVWSESTAGSNTASLEIGVLVYPHPLFTHCSGEKAGISLARVDLPRIKLLNATQSCSHIVSTFASLSRSVWILGVRFRVGVPLKIGRAYGRRPSLSKVLRESTFLPSEFHSADLCLKTEFSMQKNPY